MAIYHLSAKIIGRSSGRSATASAAYRSAEKIKDLVQGLTFNYRAREHSVNHTEILAPENAPAFCSSRSDLWNAVEKSETRKNSQVAREIEIALPIELSLEQNVILAREFARSSFVDRGMVADVCIHDAEGHNPHAHIMLTTRHLTPDGFGKKNRDWNTDELLETWRTEWQDVCNKHLQLNQHNVKIDHRTLKAQGNFLMEPQKHIGVKALAIEKRTGKPSLVRSRNQLKLFASQALDKMQFALNLKRRQELQRSLELEKNKEQVIESVQQPTLKPQQSKTIKRRMR